nr:hypothetical protein [Cupriavidus gilardii]
MNGKFPLLLSAMMVSAVAGCGGDGGTTPTSTISPQALRIAANASTQALPTSAPELAMYYRVASYPINVPPSEIDLTRSPVELGFLDSETGWALGSGSTATEPGSPDVTVNVGESHAVVSKASGASFMLCYSSYNVSGTHPNSFGCYTGTNYLGTPTAAERPTILAAMKQDFSAFAAKLAKTDPRYGIKDGHDGGKVIYKCPLNYVVNTAITHSPTSGDGDCVAVPIVEPELAMYYRLASAPTDIDPAEIDLNTAPDALGFLDAGTAWALGSGSMSPDPANPGHYVDIGESYALVTKPSRAQFLLCYSSYNISGTHPNSFGCYTGTGYAGTPRDEERPTMLASIQRDFHEFAEQLSIGSPRYGFKIGHDFGRVVFRCPAGYMVNTGAVLSPTSGANSCIVTP